jgi:hypothetical protein
MGQNFFQTDLLAGCLASSPSLKDISDWQFSDRFVNFAGQFAFSLELFAIFVIFFALLLNLFSALMGPNNNPRSLIHIFINIILIILICFGIYFTLNVEHFTGKAVSLPRAVKIFLNSFRSSYEQFQQSDYLKENLLGNAFVFSMFAALPLVAFFCVFLVVSILTLCFNGKKRKLIKSKRSQII